MRWEQLRRGSLRELLPGNGYGRIGDECADGGGSHSSSNGVVCAPVRLRCNPRSIGASDGTRDPEARGSSCIFNGFRIASARSGAVRAGRLSNATSPCVQLPLPVGPLHFSDLIALSIEELRLPQGRCRHFL